MLQTIDRPSELAALIQRYWAEVDAFNQYPDDWSNEQANDLADATFETVAHQMIGVPVRTAEDAFAAIDLLIREGEHSLLPLSGNNFYASLLRGVHEYLAGRLA